MRASERIVFTLLFSFVALGCPSKKGEQVDAQGPNSSVTPGMGPLAALETNPFQNETWMSEHGQQVPILFFERDNVRISASCRLGNGQLVCDAIKFLRSGVPVTVPRSALDGRQSAGVKVCVRLGYSMLLAHDPAGNADTFCRFPDGSLVSTGALEQYSLRVSD
jgi:putative hemolysin